MIEFACKTMIVVTSIAFVVELLWRVRALERRQNFTFEVLTTQAEFNMRVLGMPVPEKASDEVEA